MNPSDSYDEVLEFAIDREIGASQQQLWPAHVLCTSCYESISHIFSLLKTLRRECCRGHIIQAAVRC